MSTIQGAHPYYTMYKVFGIQCVWCGNNPLYSDFIMWYTCISVSFLFNYKTVIKLRSSTILSKLVKGNSLFYVLLSGVKLTSDEMIILIWSNFHPFFCSFLTFTVWLTQSFSKRSIYCNMKINHLWAKTCDFQQCGILTSIDSDQPVQPPFKLRNSKWCSVSSLTVIEYSSD